MNSFLKTVLTFLFALSALMVAVRASEVVVQSPDELVRASIQFGDRLQYTVSFHGQQVVSASAMGITVDGQDLGQSVELTSDPVCNEINEHYSTRGVHASAVNHCEAVVIAMRSGSTAWQLELRVFNDGVAYRYRVPGSWARQITGESSEWNVPIGSVLWHQAADNPGYEARYGPDIVGQLPAGLELMAPATLKLPRNLGYAMMSEANLVGYSDMSLKALAPGVFRAFFRNNPKGWEQSGEIVSPWRVTVLAADLDTLVNSDLIKNLCPPPAASLAQAPWIRPGRSIWHWLTGGAPKLEEQRGWIDGTKKLGFEYYLIDDGWREWNGGGDHAWDALKEVVDYAKSRQVAIWAWVHSKYVFTPADRAAYFQRAKKLGVVGLKIDFMDPANITWVQWYEDVLRDAAAAELMIDFHGAVKPTGRERSWPNEMTREAISGREQGKHPSIHDTTLPFVRYVQGHADYTPALFLVSRLDGSSLAHELAMSIIYTSPYLCMGDHPDRYLNSDAADVLKALPPVWDETRVLPGSEIGQLAAMARRNGTQWFIGAVNATMPCREQVTLNFLGVGRYRLVELADSADRNDAFVRSERIVTRDDNLTLPLRKDGGYVAWLVPVIL